MLWQVRRGLISGRGALDAAGVATFTAIINFRGTAGYVTDGANQTYCLGEASPVSRAGLTFGWFAFGSPATLSTADRDSALDPRFAGINYATGGQAYEFHLTLPRTGVFSVNYAIGDAGGFAESAGVVIKDNTTTLNTSGTLAYSGTEFWDISATKHATSAAWSANAVPVALTFATTSFVLELTGAGGVGAISSLVITG